MMIENFNIYLSKYKHLFIVLFSATLVMTISIVASCKAQGDNWEKLNIDSDKSQWELITPDYLTVAVAPGYEPFEYSENGELVGFDIDVAKMIAKSLDLKLYFVQQEFSGIPQALNQHKDFDIGISAIVVTKERSSYVDFSTPYYSIDWDILVYGNSNSSINESNFEEAINQKSTKIAFLNNSSFKYFFEEQYPGTNLCPYNSGEEILKALDNGEVSLALFDNEFIKSLGQNSKYKKVFTVPHKEDIAIAFSKNTPNLLDAINKVIELRLQDGSLDVLHKKYFS